MDPQDTPSPNWDERSGPLPQIPGGRYHLIERLSTGAIGGVYKALDTILDRPVAVKCVHLDTPFAEHSPDELRERFVREARIAGRLQHPNIVTIHDIVATAGHGFIIMEFIEGQSLESFLAREKRLPLKETVRLIAQLASALDYAHGRNVVHRDVKPANIIVADSLWVWVTDFGIAKSELSTNLTMAGGVLGTPDYMSPEQAKGEDVDARSDLFSLGCILFESVTGEKPFRSPSLTGVLLSIINDEPVFPLNWRSLGLPNGLKPILHHALEKDRGNRYPTGADLVSALEHLEQGTSTRPELKAVKAAEETADVPAPPEAPEPPEQAVAPKETPEPAVEPPEQAVEPEGALETVAHAAVAETLERSTPDEPAESEVTSAEFPPRPEVDAAEPESEATWRDDAEPVPAAQESNEAEEGPTAESGASEESAAESNEPNAELDVSAAAAAAEATDEPPPESDSSSEDTVILTRAPAPVDPLPPIVDPDRLFSLKEETRPLRLSPSLSGDLQRAMISPEEGFLLSRIDGHSRASDILAMSPMSEAETAAALLNLLDKELIQFGGTPAPTPTPAVPKGTPDEATIRELDRLLALAKAEEYAALLGITSDAPPAARKSAYLKIVGKYHPDKFPRADNEFRERLGRLCSEAADAMDKLANPSAAPKPETSSFHGGHVGHVGNGSSPPPRPATATRARDAANFDKRRYARELYDRALRAFDMADYWEAIQLGRQALEADDTQAEYFDLLGRALMQNKKWRREAADSFRKASELQPANIQYLGMLGAIYMAEGLKARATAVLKKAQAIDPAYTLPEIDGEVTVEAD
jgi:serine/threonine-protein kinase